MSASLITTDCSVHYLNTYAENRLQMEDIPQPTDETYSAGDKVRVYLSPDDSDGEHHGKAGTVVDVLEDSLAEETGRSLDSHSYKIEGDGRELDVWFRHRDLVPVDGQR